MKILTNKDLQVACQIMAEQIVRDGHGQQAVIFGVPRGGLPVAYLLSKYLSGSIVADNIEHATIVVDDLIDSGATSEKYTMLPFYALFDKRTDSVQEWYVFPWENNACHGADDIVTRLLQYVGEDPSRGGLHETPNRVLKAWKHWTSGYGQTPKAILKVFKDGAEDCDEMVIVKDIPVYSHCEHHMAPFFGVAHVAYIPNGKIVGLSKISRLVDIFARRLQVQERLTNQIADAMNDHLKPLGVAVVIECRHMCMESRGIQRQGASTITSSLRGVLKSDKMARAEFMGLLK